MKVRKRDIAVLALALIMFAVMVIRADDTKSAPAAPATSAPIVLQGDDAQRVKNAYQALVAADRELQFAILQARYSANVPKDYEFDLGLLRFVPPKPIAPPTATAPTKP